MGEAEKKSLAQVAAEAVITETAKAVVGPAGVAVIRIGSKLGKEFLGYWQNDDATTRESIARLNAQRDGNLPPFAVVGLGRCGSRVTAKLARMVIDAKPPEEKKQGPITSNTSKLLRLFGGRQAPNILTVEPFMVVGDIDATTFGDVEGILSQDEPGKGVSDRVLRLDYRPLAEGGAGNIPIFGEFLTRALLLVPPTDPAGIDHPWKLARTYLIDSCSRSITPTRLMFYIFSAGGGTGGGSAHEIMRAQRFAISSSSDLDPDTYFTGVTVLPYDGIQNRTRLLNTGRTFVQYLADLNIRLESAAAYQQAFHFQFGLEVEFQHGTRNISPWDSLAVISNDVMNAIVDEKTRENAEASANQYIAQQVFNMAAGQLPALAYDSDSKGPIKRDALTFNTIRLDPADLRASLAGPYSIGFSVATPEDTGNANWLDAMFVRAITLPRDNRGHHERGFVEGVSVAPDDPEDYTPKVSKLIEKVTVKAKSEQGGSLEKADFADLATIPMFFRCPRVVFVFTAPQDGQIPADVDQRLSKLLTWLMPNLIQPRYAIIRGTTAFYTLSMYMEGSVVLCPDVRVAIFNYLWLCWKNQGMLSMDFFEMYEKLVNQTPPITDDMVKEALGVEERYSEMVGNFDEMKEKLNQRWKAYIARAKFAEPVARRYSQHKIEDCAVTPAEVAAAIRYLNYLSHVTSLKPEDPWKQKKQPAPSR